MTYTIDIPGSRLRFRPIAESDAATVTRWRNTEQARQSFFGEDVVTPDTHIRFCRSRKPHDLVWMMETPTAVGVKRISDHWAGTPSFIDIPADYAPVGMTAITVDVEKHTGEYGRMMIDPAYQGQGYAKEGEYFMLWVAFEWLRLDVLWLDAFLDNEAVINLHHKTGWREAGVDILDHTHPRGDVLHMVYNCQDWLANRQEFVRLFKVELPGEYVP